MSVAVRWCVMCVMLLMFSGCGKIIDWGKKSFNQGTDVDFSTDLVRRYLRSVSVYDQLTTSAKFDVLWLGDEVRTEYAKLHARTYGKTDEQYQALLRRQLEENKHFITFYVLSLYENSLGDPESEWRLFLRVNDKNFAPTEIKVVELVPEYQTFFGKHLNRFRVPYRVMFDAKDIEDNLLVREETETVELFFRSTHKEVVLCWDIDRDNKVVVPQETEELVKPTQGRRAKRHKDQS